MYPHITSVNPLKGPSILGSSYVLVYDKRPHLERAQVETQSKPVQQEMASC